MSAGAWNPPARHGQIIVKYEAARGDTGFDAAGFEQLLPAPRREIALGVFAEYGVSDRLAVRLRTDWQDGEDAFVDYQGRGPLEVGAAWQVWRDKTGAIALYGGYAEGGEGRSAGYAAPGVGDREWEARLSLGRSLDDVAARWGMPSSFVELQAARRLRDDLPDETRIDATLGARLNEGWMLLGQAYGGAADEGARWLSFEGSVVRELDGWSFQAGWRRTAAGREAPIMQGPVVAIWRRF